MSVDVVFFFEQKTAYEMLISDWSSDVCSSDLMCIEGQRKNFEVHRLVCEAFHGPAPDGQQAAHKDGVRTNCYASNLRWATPASNTADKYGHGTILRGARHPRAKLTPDGARHIRSSGRSSRVMAEEFGVSLSVIKAGRSGQSWKSVI